MEISFCTQVLPTVNLWSVTPVRTIDILTSLLTQILNWRTNELSNLEVVTKGYDSVALALPMGAINANTNCAYSLYTDTNWLILINLTNGTSKQLRSRSV